ncbi:MAG: imidazole glycerol phosphate synthase subunit HisH [Kiritimatiellae bacterium]|nr:imidazole glycerol phosphate synthase subunit HisH [Kiritimatiellia bacterium]
MVTIVDYGAGNLTSVKNAFAALGVETEIVRDAKSVERAERVVFPGVGAAKSAMDNLERFGLTDAVRAAAVSGRPFLGICLGMQILFERSDEDGGVDTLGVVPGRVRRFPDVPGFKVPEIGWNDVRVRGESAAELCPLVDGLEFYFVHSYFAELGDATAGVTEYAGTGFTSMVRRGALWACQFHPEKSGRIGLNLLKGWLSC